MFQKIPAKQAQIKLYFIKREKLILMNSLKLSMAQVQYCKLNLIMFFSNLRMYMLLHESNEPNHLVNYSSLSKPISIGSGENNASRTMQNGALFKPPFNYSCTICSTYTIGMWYYKWPQLHFMHISFLYITSCILFDLEKEVIFNAILQFMFEALQKLHIGLGF